MFRDVVRLLLRWILITLAAGMASSCESLFGDGKSRVQVGQRIEVGGHPDRPGVADDLQEKSADDLLEARGSLQLAAGGQPELLGVPLILDEKTEYENANKEGVDPFDLAAGLWVMARGRPAGDSFQVRKLRLEKARKKWEVEGVVSSIDGRIPGDPEASFSIGPYQLRTRPGSDVSLLDPDAAWRHFLEKGPLSRRAGNEEKFLPYTIPLGERTRVGGQLTLAADHEDEYDLNRRRDRDQDKFDARIRVSMLHRIGEQAFVLAEVQLLAERDFKQGRPNVSDLTPEPGEVYIFLPNIVERFHLQIGRQNMDEKREWLYDENLDAARAYLEFESVQFEASLSQSPLTLKPGRQRPSVNAIGAIYWRAAPNWLLTAYMIDRRTRELDDFSPFLYGLRSYQNIRTGLSHWLELSRADGIVEQRRLKGSAVDLGLTWVCDHEYEPSLTLGWAWGEGSDRRGRTNRTFRQSGLQDNNGKWNGVTSFRYYGEIFDPELSNIRVLTAAIGVKPDRRSSLDLVYHSYRQDAAIAGRIRSGINAPVNGNDRDLGQELDLIFGLRRPRFALELVAGSFFPGPAFDRRATALFASFQFRYKF